MNINWSKWSAIAEIISSIAILVTLIYLSIQTHQNTVATQANTRQTMITTDLNVLNAGLDHPSIGTAMTTEKELSAKEANQLTTWLIMLLRTREYQWFQYKNGLLDKQTWEAYLTGIKNNLSHPRTRDWWNQVGYDLFDHEFADEVNKYLADIPVAEDANFPNNQMKKSTKP